jgi:tartrate-resistant acid phosphatase type 5
MALFAKAMTSSSRKSPIFKPITRLVLLLAIMLLAACGPSTVMPTEASQDTATVVQAATALPPTTPATQPAPPATSEIVPSATASQPPSITPTQTFLPLVTSTTPANIRFAVIGDFGSNQKPEADVAALVKSWQPDFVITVGDNNYPNGAASTIDLTIGQYYSDFIHPYVGQYGPGAPENHFYPTLGNHDWVAKNAQPYLDYFTLPGNERYYEFTIGPLGFFALDADSHEPDGVSAGSKQAQWLKDRLAASTEPWKIVFFHQAPYSSALHGSTAYMQWPFREWGASVVLSGHDHTYERLSIDGMTYFVNGLGGGAIYGFYTIVKGSQMRYNADYGAMLVEANSSQMTFQFINRKGKVIDTYTQNIGQ